MVGIHARGRIEAASRARADESPIRKTMTRRDDKPTILLVDDDAGTLIAMDAVLQELPVHILLESSARAALKRVLTETISLIILDVSMPEIDGYEATKQIRATERGRSIPIIMVTGMMVEIDDQFKGYQSGAIDFLLKPVDNDVLKIKVRDALNLKHHV